METSNSFAYLFSVSSDESDEDINRSKGIRFTSTDFTSSTKEILFKDDDLPQETDQNYENRSVCSHIESDDVILSVYWKRGKLGAAYYTSSDAEIHLLNDVTDIHPDFNNLKYLVGQVNPSQVLTLASLSDAFIQALSDALNGVTESTEEIVKDEEERTNRIFLMSSKRKDLSYEACKRYILDMRFGFEPEGLKEDDHVLFMSSHIDLNKEAMVISMGMLVKFLEKHLPEINLTHEPLQIMFIRHTTIGNLVSVDTFTYKALQIFNPRVHPSAFKRNASGFSHEGLSLFAIFGRCKSKIGTKRMREIFLNPSKNVEEINERLDVVDFCRQPQHQHIVKNLRDCIKNVENVSGNLANIYRARAKISNWRSLYGSLYHAILIGEICGKHSSRSTFMAKMANSITPSVHEVTHYMNQIIDFKESTLKNRFVVRVGVDAKLDMLRQTYEQIPEVLIKVAEIELEELPSFVKECSIIYITELGYLLSVPVWKGDGSEASDYALPNFDVKFVVNNYVHYKTPRCAELDDVLGDTLASISNLESSIMITLIQFIHARISHIIKAVKLVAELDCAIAFSVVAVENNYSRPVITKGRKIAIIEGRHPLQELCVDNFVSNSTYFGCDEHRVTILTGPNASGKSVYLKQVALIAFMAHIGSFVPAQSAEICLLDHIHSRIQTVESISTRMSAFLLDLKQMSFSIYNSTPNSLIVVDEFGKGTSEVDGLSLLTASLIHFIERDNDCPFLLVSTHFHSLPKLLPSTKLVNLQSMDYVIENDEIIYLHKMKEGVSGSSMTLLAAKAAGLPENIIKRCLELQFAKGPIKCNPDLKITQRMLKEISFMEKIIELVLEEEGKKNSNNNSNNNNHRNKGKDNDGVKKKKQR